MSGDNPRSSAETTLVYNTNNPSATLISINMSNITKLTHLNYIMWSRQIRALLEGHELHQFLEAPAPPPTIVVDGDDSPNPDLAPWRRHVLTLVAVKRVVFKATVSSIVQNTALYVALLALPLHHRGHKTTTTTDPGNHRFLSSSNNTGAHKRIKQ